MMSSNHQLQPDYKEENPDWLSGKLENSDEILR